MVLGMNLALHFALPIKYGMYWWAVGSRVGITILLGFLCAWNQKTSERRRREIEQEFVQLRHRYLYRE